MAAAVDMLLAELRRKHRGWTLWDGVAGLKYARKMMSSPPVVFRGETWEDIERQIAEHKGATR